MTGVVRGVLVAAMAFTLACGVSTETEGTDLSTSSQELKDGTILGADFQATVAPTVDCATRTVSFSGTISSAGSGTEAEVYANGELVGVITEKDFVGKAIKSASYSATFTAPTDGDYPVCFVQSGAGGRVTKQFCTTISVSCVQQ